MKRLVYIIVFASLLLVSSWMNKQDGGNAVVERRSGVDVYAFSTPDKDYEVLESGKITVLLSCNESFNKAINKASKEGGDGVIIYLSTKRYDIIKYKKTNFELPGHKLPCRDYL